MQGDYDFVLVIGRHKKRAHGKLKVSDKAKAKDYYRVGVLKSRMHTAASKQPNPPRCLMISSIGANGSSWFVRFLLQLFNGNEGFTDYEKADKRMLEEKDVPFVVIRPAGLTNKQGKGKYQVIDKPTVFFPNFIARADVAKFFVDCLSDTSFNGKAVMIEGV